MKKKLFFSLLMSAVCGLGFSQTFDNIPTGSGYYLNKVIASPPSVYETPAGDLTTDDAGNTRITQELTLEYYEFRGTPNAVVPSNLYFVNIEGDGEGTATTMGRVDEAIQLGDGTRTFGSNGILAIVSNYTDENTNVVTTNPYAAILAANGSGATVITIELTGDNVDGSSSSNVSTQTPDIGYDGNIEDFAVTYMLITSGTEAAPINPQGHDLDADNDGVIDTTGDHTSWTLYDSIAYLDNDDELTDTRTEDGLVVNDTGEYGYGQIVFARDYSAGSATNYKVTTSATIVPVSGGNISFMLRQGLKTGSTINDWIAAAVADASFPTWTFSGNTSRVFPASFANYTMPDSIYGELNPVEANAWNGSTSSDWADITNWDLGIVPDVGSEVTIPNGLTNYPTISSAVTVNSIDMASGASLIANASVTGEVTYNRTLTSDWHLISAPVAGETIEDVIANHTFATGTGSNIGLGVYNANGTDTYFYASSSLTGAIEAGKGYAVKLASAGDASITGSLTTSDVSFVVTAGANDTYNLLGNPYTAYINSSTFTAANSTALSEQTVWLWDGTQYLTYNTASPIEIAPGQGFFVIASAPAFTLFETSNQSHQTADTFMKQEPNSNFELFVENGQTKSSTKVFYIDDKTTGFDNGFDSSIFSGDGNSNSLFTELVSNNEGQKLAIQTLPKENSNTIVVPVGLIAKAGDQLTFSAESYDLPNGMEIFLEDRTNNTFTNLSVESYKTTLTDDSNGTGKFYIHSAGKSLSTNDNGFDQISIYKSSTSELTVSGLNSTADITITSLLGKQILSKNIDSNGNSKINLPSLSSGIYIVNLTSDLGEVTKKIVLE